MSRPSSWLFSAFIALVERHQMGSFTVMWRRHLASFVTVAAKAAELITRCLSGWRSETGHHCPAC